MLLNKDIEEFICMSSMQFFKRFEKNTDFLTTDQSKQDSNKNLKKIKQL